MGEVLMICKRILVSIKLIKLGRKIIFFVFDFFMENYYIKMVYYYLIFKGLEIISILRVVMFEMLMYFLIIIGRLIRDDDKGKWMIKCNDVGVRMVEVSVKGSVVSWL